MASPMEQIDHMDIEIAAGTPTRARDGHAMPMTGKITPVTPGITVKYYFTIARKEEVAEVMPLGAAVAPLPHRARRAEGLSTRGSRWSVPAISTRSVEMAGHRRRCR